MRKKTQPTPAQPARPQQARAAMPAVPAPEPVESNSRAATVLALVGLAVLLLLLFRGTLWQTASVLGSTRTDMACQFIAWRKFGFESLAGGDFPFWNPYIFGGAPFFGGMQSGLLYPPNFIFMIMPLIAALNWSIAINMWLLGAFVFAWARVRGVSVIGAFFAGAVAMLGGTVTPHVYAGHMPNLCTVPWAPLILLGIDGWIDRRRIKWLLIAMAAVAIQIVAGHMQYVFFTAVAAGVYSLFRLAQSRHRISTALGLLCIYPAGALLAGVQLLPAMEASAESVRSGVVPWQFVASFSFHPENFLTAVAPGILGRAGNYWGQCYFWELEVFIGIAGLSLAALGIAGNDRRRVWPIWAALAVCIVLALGRFTPLLWLLYSYVPGFGMFRGYSKFIFQASLFMAILAGMGLDSLRQRGMPRGFAIGLIVVAILLFGGAGWVWSQSANDWGHLILRAIHRDELQVPYRATIETPAFQARAQSASALSLLVACLSFAGLTAVAFADRRRRWAHWAFVAFGVAELMVYANAYTITFKYDDLRMDEMRKVAGDLGDGRVLLVDPPNNTMLLGIKNTWGNDPYVLRRYAEYVTWANGGKPNEAKQYIKFERDVPGNALLRMHRILYEKDDQWVSLESKFPRMPHVFLTGKWIVTDNRDKIFYGIGSGESNLWREAFVERDPGLGRSPANDAHGKPEIDESVGSARIVEDTPDRLVIEAEALKPSILVITDAYAKGWRARPLEGSSQSQYEIIPANYWMRGVPLQPGKHKIALEYTPVSFAAGMWISGLVLLLYVSAWVLARNKTISIRT